MEREATGSPVLKCSLMTAASTAWPRASGDQSACVGFVEARIAIDFSRDGERGCKGNGTGAKGDTASGAHL